MILIASAKTYKRYETGGAGQGFAMYGEGVQGVKTLGARSKIRQDQVADLEAPASAPKKVLSRSSLWFRDQGIRCVDRNEKQQSYLLSLSSLKGFRIKGAKLDNTLTV